jgi:dATP pyrophosphohydrolase
MIRAPFQVLVLPFHIESAWADPRYAVFRRRDAKDGCWQGIAGGGQVGEEQEGAARREAKEEAGIADSAKFMRLASMTTLPVVNISGFCWGPDVLVVPEYSFGAEVESCDLRLSREHIEYRWAPYEEARELLTWDSNKNALWELNHRLSNRVKT